MATEQELNSMTPAEIKAAYEQEAANPPEEVVVYTRRVTDPDGVERVYQSEESMEDLIDKIVAGRAEHQPAPVPEAPRVRTADEEFCLAQEFATEPSKAFDKMLFERTGLTPEGFRQQVAATVAQQNNAVAEAFVASEKSYLANSVNGKIMTDYLKKLGRDESKPLTIADLKAAYEACKPLLQEREPEFDPWNASLSDLRKAAGGTPGADVKNDGWDF